MAPERRRGPPINLVLPEPLHESVRAAQLAELAPWVKEFSKQHAELWPAAGTGPQGPVGSYRRRFPWPDCWGDHPSLVIELQVLRMWSDALAYGDVDLAEVCGGDAAQWLRHVEDVTGPRVQTISRVCMVTGTMSHVDMTKPRRPGSGAVGDSDPSEANTGIPAQRTTANPSRMTRHRIHRHPPTGLFGVGG